MAESTARGAEAGAAFSTLNSPETYIGFQRAERFVSPGGHAKNRPKTYAAAPLSLNDWALEGQWTVGAQSARSTAAPAAISYRFHARDLHLVLGSPTGRPIRFRVTIDGRAPGADAGVDVKPDGTGAVTEERLSQLVRQ
jgi:hypothetical protein